jgi:hypothetical protein
MDNYMFRYGFSGFKLHDGWFYIVVADYKPKPKQIFIIANQEVDKCSFDKLMDDGPDGYKVYINNIEREYIGQKPPIRFHILYQAPDNRYFKQTLKYDGSVFLSLPEEIMFNYE